MRRAVRAGAGDAEMDQADVSSQPYWWDTAPLYSGGNEPVAPTCDVVVIGAGYTGLSAALTLARAGRSVQVIEKQLPGEGASTRNGGICSGNIRPSLSALRRSFGEERAAAILREGKEAREDLGRFIKAEGLACDYAMTGRFAGAIDANDYETLARDAEYLRKTLNIEAYATSKADQRGVIGTDFYHGGAVRMDIGGLHPAKLHAGMLRLAREAGVVIHHETAATGFERAGPGYLVRTARGDVSARDVIAATNAYTDASDAWVRRRIVPVRSRIIATQELSQDLMARLMPAGMMCGDTRQLSYYYRPSPDGRRILFGGRDGAYAGDSSWPTTHLRREMTRIFPELSDTAITHSWYGYVGMNRDMIPRIFTHDGVRYATGYCGSGVVWARWNGMKAALNLLGDPKGTSAFDFRPPAAVPFFNGTAWFMPALFAWLSAQDGWKMRKAG